MFLLASFSANCQRTNSDVDRNCIKTCLSDDDCPGNWKCLCDGDCGLSCVKNSKCIYHISYGNLTVISSFEIINLRL